MGIPSNDAVRPTYLSASASSICMALEKQGPALSLSLYKTLESA
jgi:hypothetical protein